MVRIPTTPRVEQMAAFPELDHTPELDAQERFRAARERGQQAKLLATMASLPREPRGKQRKGYTNHDPDVIPNYGVVKVGVEIAEQAARERAALAAWVRGGEKGPKPARPAIEALRARAEATDSGELWP